MNTIAAELNRALENTAAGQLLSDLGRRLYFPKGIVAQSAEAKQKAKRFNATVGMAKQGGQPMFLPSIFEKTSGLGANDFFPYAPTPGDPELRSAWKEEMLRKNPSLEGKAISLPVVTSGLTHGILLAADLFLDKGDTIIIPDMFWGNYRLIFEERREARILPFPFFSEDGGIDIKALDQALSSVEGNKASLILNFPNNPTGYSPSKDEYQAIADLLKAHAQTGKQLMVITDDAYFGLFYEEDTATESLFSVLSDLDENILAVKVDGSTKEDFVWGFRVGFLTYGAKGMTEQQYNALVQKTMGAVRSSVSNCSRPAQTLILQGLKSPSYQEEKLEAFMILKSRYEKVKEVLAKYEEDTMLVPLPFNSGYFMAFTCKGDAEQLRLYLLDQYQIGTIAIAGKYLRIAFSSVDRDSIEELYDVLYTAAHELWS